MRDLDLHRSFRVIGRRQQIHLTRADEPDRRRFAVHGHADAFERQRQPDPVEAPSFATAVPRLSIAIMR
jgi:hypothetical protein